MLVLFPVLMAEIVLRGLVAAQWIRMPPPPVVMTPRKYHKGGRLLDDISPYYGVWRYPNREATMKMPGGPVNYSSNEHGMRDRPRSLRSAAAPRFVVLGDSFAEGYMVPVTNRFTDLVEQETGVELMNFGISGSFGSIQEWMLYEHLASNFDHTGVLLFFLPDNDFEDNDPRMMLDSRQQCRYRPYLAREGDQFRVYYPFDFSLIESREKIPHPHQTWNTWCQRIYLLNLVNSLLPRARPYHADLSSYDDYSGEDIDRLLFTYEKIIERAAPRPVTIFVIPRERDLKAFAAGTHQGRVLGELDRLVKKYPQVRVVDLMDHFAERMRRDHVDYKHFFLSYDPHWNAEGHRVAADAVLNALPELSNVRH